MAQATDRKLRRVGPWVVALLLAALAGGLIAGYLLLTKRDMAILFEGLRPAEASAVVEELDAQSIVYELADGGATILTTAEQRDATRLKLAGAELQLSGQEGLELFDTSDIGLTEFAQRIKYQRALQGELTRTIMKINGVLEARIHISIPERSTFRSERSPAKAAVTLLTRSPEVETPETIAGIQQLVAASIVDLAASNVVVLNGRGAIISPSATALPTRPAAATEDIPLLAAVTGAIPTDAAPAVFHTPNIEPATGGTGAPGNQIKVTTDRPLTEDERKATLAAVQSSRGTGVGEAQVIFELQPPAHVLPVVSPEGSPDVAARQPDADMASPATNSNPDLAPVVIGLLVLAIFAAAVMIAVLRRPGRRLSVDDQRRFAERLRLGLQSQTAEAIDGAS